MLLPQLTDRISAAVWNLHPGWAVAVGRHEYDGQVPDLSAGAIAAGLERLGLLRAQLEGLAGLTVDEQWEREVLLGVVAREHFDLERLARWRRDPAWYLRPLDVSVYLERDYAPGGLRLERAASLLGEAGGLLAQGRENLAGEAPRPWVERGAAQARRLARRLVVQAEWAPAGSAASAEAAWLLEAASHAAGELEAYASWLEAERLPGAADEFALGAAGLAEWLRAAEGLDWVAADLEATARAQLAEDRERCGSCGGPSGGPASAAGARSAGLEGALLEAVNRTRRFVEERGLATVPDTFTWRAGMGYPGATAGLGWLQAPGPYDDPATPAVLYLAPEAASRPGVLVWLAVTEGFPGRLLLALHAARALGEARRRFSSAGFCDGWEGYAADILLEAGYAWDVGVLPEWRRNALLTDCRMLVVAGLHAGCMTLDEAAGLFVTEARLDEAAARREALRCTGDPAAAAAGLGRAVLRRLRGRYGGPPGEVPSARFHDRLLSAAALPLGLLDRLAGQ